VATRFTLVFELLPSNPSPGPLRLVKAPATGQPSPLGRGLAPRTHQKGALSLGERVASVASRVRGPFSSSELRLPSNLRIRINEALRLVIELRKVGSYKRRDYSSNGA
jgi:hypothetical protein